MDWPVDVLRSIAAMVLVASSMGLAEEALWVHPKCRPLPTDKLGPFVVLGDGGLMCVERNATCISKDNGKTWSEPRKIYDGARPGIPSEHSVILRTRGGVLVLVYMDFSTKKWAGWDKEKNDSAGDARLDVWAIRSLDEGKTWIDRQKIFSGWCGCLVNMIQTKSGHIVVPASMLLHKPGRHAMRSYVSTDDGATWTYSNIIDLGGAGSHQGAMEGTVVELDDGRVLMLIRTIWRQLWSAYSDDQGLSWRTIGPSGIKAPSSKPFVIRLANGRIALIWNHSPQGTKGKDRFPRDREDLSIAFADGNAENWTTPVMIARAQKGHQCAYPDVCQPRPGVLWVITKWTPNNELNLRASLQVADFDKD